MSTFPPIPPDLADAFARAAREQTERLLSALAVPPDVAQNAVVTVLDTRTGRTAQDDRWTHFWWTDGNGSCDCNRQLLFKPGADCTGECVGCNRYLVVEVDGLPATPEYNSDYPPELLARFGPRPPQA